MKLKILTYPHPGLRRKAKAVTKIDGALKRLARQMLDLMYKERGVGLAATQVGKPIHLVVINLTQKPAEELVLINPRLEKKTGQVQEPEGCLSLPGVSAKVPRAGAVVCRALNLEGKEFIIDTSTITDKERAGVLSRVLQHEIDHLGGIIFIDYLSESAKAALAAQLQELETKAPR